MIPTLGCISVQVGLQYTCYFQSALWEWFAKDLVHSASVVKYDYSHSFLRNLLNINYKCIKLLFLQLSDAKI